MRIFDDGGRGQAVLLDFMVGMMLFVLMWIYISGQFGLKMSESQSNDTASLLRIKSEYALDTLVRSQGSPQNWETFGINSLNYPGLATQDRQLSQQKLAAFSNFTANYPQLKDSMGLGEYDFYFTFSAAGTNINAGLAPSGNATQAVAQRVVSYGGSMGTATLNVYKLAG